jgi:hypothetical protein
MAVPIRTREAIVHRRIQGQILASIAVALNINYQTVSNIWRRYHIRGLAGLTPEFHRRKRRNDTPPAANYNSLVLVETRSSHVGSEPDPQTTAGAVARSSYPK